MQRTIGRRALRAEHNALIHPEVGFSTLSSHMNLDFARLPHDMPVAELEGMQGLFGAGACGGFVVTPAHPPRAFDAFADQVVPELQARGLFRTTYKGTTLREQLHD